MAVDSPATPRRQLPGFANFSTPPRAPPLHSPPQLVYSSPKFGMPRGMDFKGGFMHGDILSKINNRLNEMDPEWNSKHDPQDPDFNGLQ
ncbi:hypothetical protein HGRIS_011992 [Hohenbuehelia grisea]|uniref:Uncharacterized protein n=1 Tax=Hohenbuehelia grisea TaxID=104357 RepID=A0ABR3JYI6_9AGAR